ncbi:hypothetical protein [Streptomyces novaecaesareae]|uniref:hypothetical protein n=1 Tax=Streptomyces novaecaesareae TaxID=68244 RepID=UPI000B10AC5E|nr:hypothetical protein [Streptomyces novaecaesareae]
MSVPRRRRRLPDEVRAAAVRAVLCLSFTLVGVVVATLASYAGSWMLTPALLAMGVGVFGTMWCLLEILISSQVAAQRMRAPNSAHPMAGGRTSPRSLSHSRSGASRRNSPGCRPPGPERGRPTLSPAAGPGTGLRPGAPGSGW